MTTLDTRPADRTVAPRGERSRRSMTLARRKSISGFLFTVPAVVLVLLIVVVPIIYAIWISLNDWPLFGDAHYIGAKNYTALPHNTVFVHSILFTLLYTAIVTLPILVIGYGLAAFVRSNRRGSTTFRVMFFLPTVVGLSTLSFMYLVELQPNSGTVNVVLKALHLTDGQTVWSLKPTTGLLIVCALIIWFSSGGTMMLLLGGMKAIPKDVYEAAELDGTSKWQQEWYVTIPLMRRFIAMALVLSVVGSFLAFQQFLVLTQGGPGTSTTTVIMWVYHEAFLSQRIGSATAMGLVVAVVIGSLTALQLFVLREDR